MKGSWLSVFIRGMWTFIFPGLGFIITFLVDQWTSLDVPMWIGLAIGSFCYMLKRRYFPDSTF